MKSSTWMVGWVGTTLALASGCAGNASSGGGHTASVEDTGGGASTGGSATGGSSASTGGTFASSMGGADTGGADTGGADTGGADTGGADTGGADCVDVCELYGGPCCFESGSCIELGGSCVLEVFATALQAPPHEYATLEAEVAALPQEILLSIPDTDVAQAAADPAPASRIELTLTARASALYGEALEEAAFNPFRLSCNGESLFLGVSYFSCGAAAIDAPVLHVGRNEENLVVLALGAYQGAWCGLGPGSTRAAARIDRRELREVFCQRDVLEPLDADAKPPDR